MTVLTIRAGKRYAVRQPLRVHGPDGAETRGLLIELSQEGCRISNHGAAKVKTGDAVTIELDDLTLHGFVRWTNPGVFGLRFEPALHAPELQELVARDHPEPGARYGICG